MYAVYNTTNMCIRAVNPLLLFLFIHTHAITCHFQYHFNNICIPSLSWIVFVLYFTFFHIHTQCQISLHNYFSSISSLRQKTFHLKLE